MNTDFVGPQETFLSELREHVREGRVSRVVFAKYSGPELGLVRVTVRPLVLRNVASLSLVASYATRDITKNYDVPAGLEEVQTLMNSGFARIHLLTADEDIELAATRKGAWTLRRSRVSRAIESSPTHDRTKTHSLQLDEPFLTDLGVTDRQHRLIPAMSRKWKQINKFTEVLENAIAQSPLRDQQKIAAVDFGSGKGYLTFALFVLLTRKLKREAIVTGVEMRADLAMLTQTAARNTAFSGLSFVEGAIEGFATATTDIMVALHACDTATDHAIHFGIACNASIIVCSPCCHKELRPQMTWPTAIHPLMRHGVHQGAQAEMLTDALRSLFLEACGYETKVFEFISPEETSKNKMILAVKRATPLSLTEQHEVAEQISQLKSFFGIRSQTLEELLQRDRLGHVAANSEPQDGMRA